MKNPKTFRTNCGDGETQLPELILTLRKRLQETTETTDLDYLRNIRTDDEFLTKILRTRQYNLERAYKSVLNYYKSINNYFADIVSDPSSTSANVVPVFNANTSGQLNATACKSSSRTLFVNFEGWDTKEFNMYKLQQAAAFLYEDITQHLETQLNGCSVIMDYKGLSFQHLKQLTPTEIKRGIYGLQDGIPIRIIAYHIVNYPVTIWGLYNIAKMFLKEKMRKRIHFHPNLDSLHEYFHKEHLPISLGGTLEDNDLTDHNAMIENFIAKDFHWKEYFTPKMNSCDNNDHLYKESLGSCKS